MPAAALKQVLTECLTYSLRVRCPTGILEFTACSNGLHELNLIEPSVTIDSTVSVKPLDSVISCSPDEQCREVLKQTTSWLEAYFTKNYKQLNKMKPKLCSTVFNYDSFRSAVWCTLERDVLFGQTVSYGELAKMCGHPGAAQAVGTAMRRNPVSLIVPCHRVVKSTGQCGNYSGGKLNDTKVWLITHEKN